MMEYASLTVVRVLSRALYRVTVDNAPQVSSAMTRRAVRLATVGLTSEAKRAFEEEIQNSLLELIWDDLKAALSPEAVVSGAALRAVSVLWHFRALRSDYRAIGSVDINTKTSAVASSRAFRDFTLTAVAAFSLLLVSGGLLGTRYFLTAAGHPLDVALQWGLIIGSWAFTSCSVYFTARGIRQTAARLRTMQSRPPSPRTQR